jgi:hypothetical protein
MAPPDVALLLVKLLAAILPPSLRNSAPAKRTAVLLSSEHSVTSTATLISLYSAPPAYSYTHSVVL